MTLDIVYLAGWGSALVAGFVFGMKYERWRKPKPAAFAWPKPERRGTPTFSERLTPEYAAGFQKGYEVAEFNAALSMAEAIERTNRALASDGTAVRLSIAPEPVDVSVRA